LLNELGLFPIAKQDFNGDGFGRLLPGKCLHNKGGNHEVDGKRITLSVRGRSRMDQLFSLGHVSGATKILELARRGMTSGWLPAEKRAGLFTPVEIHT
jgi:hypothetical protein